MQTALQVTTILQELMLKDKIVLVDDKNPGYGKNNLQGMPGFQVEMEKGREADAAGGKGFLFLFLIRNTIKDPYNSTL